MDKPFELINFCTYEVAQFGQTYYIGNKKTGDIVNRSLDGITWETVDVVTKDLKPAVSDLIDSLPYDAMAYPGVSEAVEKVWKELKGIK